MKNRMLDAADVLVNGHPVFRFGLVQGAGGEVRTTVAEKIPGRFDEGIHRVGLTPGHHPA